VQEQSRGTTDVKRNTASTARFLLKLWDYSVGRVWTALINVVKGIFGKKNEPFGSKDSPVKFLSEERTSVLPPIANAALTEAAVFDEDRVSVRQRENLLEARRLMEQKLREIDGRPRRVVAGLQLEISNQEAADAAEDVGDAALNYVDGILPSAELTTAMPMNGPDEDTTAAMDDGAINSLAAMPENDTTSAVGYGAIDALANIPEEDVIAVSEVTSDAVVVVPGSMWSQIKSKGTSGIISYVITELAFWTLFPLLLYVLPPGEDAASVTSDNVKLLGLSLGFITVARFAVPFRFALSLSLIPLVEENLTKRLLK